MDLPDRRAGVMCLADRQVRTLQMVAVVPGQDAVTVLAEFHNRIPVRRAQRCTGREAVLGEGARDLQVAARDGDRHIDDLFERERASCRRDAPVPVHQPGRQIRHGGHLPEAKRLSHVGDNLAVDVVPVKHGHATPPGSAAITPTAGNRRSVVADAGQP
jgi:hypothetical protein